MNTAAPAPGRAATATARRRAHRALAREVRRLAANFYYPFLLLPPRRRRAIFALYGFCRAADDVADGPGSAAERRQGLERYRQALQATLDGHPPGPRWLALADAVEAFHLDPLPLQTIIDGCAADCAPLAVDTLQDLERYAYQVAGAVGLLSAQIFGYRDPAVPQLAIRLGFAMQLTNVLRDLREDAQRQRRYLPREDLERFRCPEAALATGPVGPAAPAYRALLRFEVARARESFAAARPLIPLLDRSARGCPAALAAVYLALLERIEARGYDVQSQRVSLPLPAKVGAVLRAYAAATWRP